MSLLVDTNIVIDKVAGLLPILEARGTVHLFAFAEEKEIDRWDIVLSSEWSDKDSTVVVRFVSNELRLRLEPQELTLISRIAVIPSNDPKVFELTRRLKHITPKDNLVVHGALLGSDIQSAHIFRVEPTPSAVLGDRLDSAVHA